MNDQDLARKRNDTARLINFQDRRHRNCVRLNPANSTNHELKKASMCLAFLRDGKEFVTEARFADGSGRADIVVLDDCVAWEIVHSESEMSILQKRARYPMILKVVKA